MPYKVDYEAGERVEVDEQGRPISQAGKKTPEVKIEKDMPTGERIRQERIQAEKQAETKKTPTAVMELAEDRNITPSAALETVKRYQQNPQAGEFQALPQDDLEKLHKAAVKDIEQTTIKLADNTLVTVESWNKIPEKYQGIGLNQGYQAMDRAMTDDRLNAIVRQQKQQEATEKLKNYELTAIDWDTGEVVPQGYNIAHYLRDNPGEEKTLEKAGFARAEIDKAKQANYEYLGVGATPPPDRDKYIQEYFDERGWGNPSRSQIKPSESITVLDKRREQAIEAYEKKYAPPMTLDEFQRNYFEDKGWKHGVRRTDMIGREVTQYDNRVLEATKAYQERFGTATIVEQSIGKIADFVVPGRYVVKNWDNLSDTEKALNIAIDVVFVGALFGKPIAKGIIRSAGVVDRFTTNQATRIVDEMAARLRTAAKTDDVVRFEAQLRNNIKAAETMKEAGIPGMDAIIQHQKIMLNQLDKSITMSKLMPSSDFESALRRLGNEAITGSQEKQMTSIKADFRKGTVGSSKWSDATLPQEVEAVAKGEKPLAEIYVFEGFDEGKDALAVARKNKLKIEMTHDRGEGLPKNYIVYQDNAIGRNAKGYYLKKETNPLEGAINQGKAFGYSEDDIAAYLHQNYKPADVAKYAPEWYEAATGVKLPASKGGSMLSREGGFLAAEEAKGTPVTRRLKVDEVAITAREAAESGLTDREIIEIAERVGNNREAILREISRIKANKKAFQLIDDAIKKDKEADWEKIQSQIKEAQVQERRRLKLEAERKTKKEQEAQRLKEVEEERLKAEEAELAEIKKKAETQYPKTKDKPDTKPKDTRTPEQKRADIREAAEKQAEREKVAEEIGDVNKKIKKELERIKSGKPKADIARKTETAAATRQAQKQLEKEITKAAEQELAKQGLSPEQETKIKEKIAVTVETITEEIAGVDVSASQQEKLEELIEQKVKAEAEQARALQAKEKKKTTPEAAIRQKEKPETETMVVPESIIEQATDRAPGPDTVKPKPPVEPPEDVTVTDAPPKAPPDVPPKTPPEKPPKPPEKPPKKPSKKPLKRGSDDQEEKEWTPKQIKSAVAWKDGVVVHAIKAPYRRGIDEATFSVKNLPPGLQILNAHFGSGSQQRSIKVTGRFPKKLTVDVGNQDVILTRTKGNRVRMRHVRDTRGTVSQTTIKRNGRNISRKVRRGVYSTNVGGGQVLSHRPLRGY